MHTLDTTTARISVGIIYREEKKEKKKKKDEDNRSWGQLSQFTKQRREIEYELCEQDILETLAAREKW